MTKPKKKYCMILLIDAGKALDKNSILIYGKNNILTRINIGIDNNYLNLTKNIFQKPTTNVILNGEQLEDFLLRSKKYNKC